VEDEDGVAALAADLSFGTELLGLCLGDVLPRVRTDEEHVHRLVGVVVSVVAQARNVDAGNLAEPVLEVPVRRGRAHEAEGHEDVETDEDPARPATSRRTHHHGCLGHEERG
jgi:hypothetical protein